MNRRTKKPIDPSDLRAIRVHLGLDYMDMAAFLGMPENNGGDTVRKWERGTRVPPRPVTLLYREFAEGWLRSIAAKPE